MRRLWKQIAALLCLTGCAGPTAQGPILHWAIYYDDVLKAKAFETLDLVVFDRRHHPEIKPLKGHTIVLAYISIGEVYDDVAERKTLEKEKVLLSQNTLWKSHSVDPASATWRTLVLGYAEDAAKQGFDGFMLDTADSPIHWAEAKAPDRVETMREGVVALIKAIRAAHPNMKIMLNRGFSILPQVAQDIDYALAESIYTNTDVSSGQFALFATSSYLEVAKQLQSIGTLAPGLKIFTIDYWDMDDVNGLERIYAVQRAQGFIPYVTTPDLRNFTPEPRLWHRRHKS